MEKTNRGPGILMDCIWTAKGWINAAFRAHYTGYHKVSEAKVTNVDFMTLNYGLTSLYNFYSAKI